MHLENLLTGLPDCNITTDRGYMPSFGGTYMYRQGSLHQMLKPGDLIPREGYGLLFGTDCVQVIKNFHKTSFLLLSSALISALSLLTLLTILRFYALFRPLKKAGIRYSITLKGLRMDTSGGLKSLGLGKLLFCLLLFRPLVSACIDPTRLGPLMSLRMSEGDTICFPEGHTTLVRSYSSHPLAEMYETANWELKTSFSWGCGGGSCPEVEDCESIDGQVESRSSTLDGYLKKTHCTSYPRACAFSRGCWQGVTVITWKGHMGKVFSILPGRIDGAFSSVGVGCNISVTAMPLSAPPEGFLVMNDGGAYLCESVSNMDDPRSGKVGDLQRRSTLSFSWESVACSSGWYTDHSCVITKHMPLEDICVRLPGIYKGRFSTVEKGKLMISLTDEILVMATCNKTTEVRKQRCKNVKVDIEGYRESNTGLSIMASAESEVEGDEVVVSLNCSSPLTIRIPCDGRQRFYSHSEGIECHGVSDNSKGPRITMTQTLYTGKSLVTRVLENEKGFVSSLGITGLLFLGIGIIFIAKM